MALKEVSVELKELQKSMDRSIGRQAFHDLTGITLRMAVNTVQSNPFQEQKVLTPAYLHFSPFPTIFSKSFLYRDFQTQDCQAKGQGVNVNICTCSLYFFCSFSSMSKVPGTKREKFQKKTLSKLAVRLLKLYRVPQGTVSNFLVCYMEKFQLMQILSFHSSFALTHNQMTNFRLFQTERVCRRQFQI